MGVSCCFSFQLPNEPVKYNEASFASVSEFSDIVYNNWKGNKRAIKVKLIIPAGKLAAKCCMSKRAKNVLSKNCMILRESILNTTGNASRISFLKYVLCLLKLILSFIIE